MLTEEVARPALVDQTLGLLVEWATRIFLAISNERLYNSTSRDETLLGPEEPKEPCQVHPRNTLHYANYLMLSMLNATWNYVRAWAASLTFQSLRHSQAWTVIPRGLRSGVQLIETLVAMMLPRWGPRQIPCAIVLSFPPVSLGGVKVQNY